MVLAQTEDGPEARPAGEVVPSDLPPAVAEALAQVAELNEWAILSVASDPAALLPTGRLASDMLRRAWDPTEGTFNFRDR